MNRFYLLILHVLLGVISAQVPVVATIWIYLFTLYSARRILRYKNADGWAMYTVVYMASSDVFIRMAGTIGIFYEFSKYSLVVFLIIAVNLEKSQRKLPGFAVLYFLLLLPSIFMCDMSDFNLFRRSVSFNLSGPASLALATVFFYERKITKEQLNKLFQFSIYPIIAVLMVVFWKMPTLEKANFTLSSSDQLSGGFGPNQVATQLGYAFMLISLAWILKLNVFYNVLIDRIIGFLMLGFAIMTFSRGGVITPLVCLLLSLYTLARASGNIQQFVRVIQIILLAGVAGFFMWGYLNALTGDALDKRYNKASKQRASATDKIAMNKDIQLEGVDLGGRENIFLIDLQVFRANPIAGVGPGQAKKYRDEIAGLELEAHTEYSRLLAEHGMYGLIALFIILLAPIQYYRNLKRPVDKMIFVCFFVFSSITTIHSAMRLSMVGLTYGLAFMKIEEPAGGLLLVREKKKKKPELKLKQIA